MVMTNLGPDLMVYDLIVNCSKVLNCRKLIVFVVAVVLMSMVGMHIPDYQNGVDLVVDVDRRYIEHERFPFSNCARVVGNTTTKIL